MKSRKPHTFRLKSELVKRMKHIAVELGVPFNALVEEGLELVIKKYEMVLREQDRSDEKREELRETDRRKSGGETS